MRQSLSSFNVLLGIDDRKWLPPLQQSYKVILIASNPVRVES